MYKINFSLVAEKRKGMLGIYIRCMQFDRQLLLNTQVSVFQDEWDEASCLVVKNPNAKSLNVYLRKCVYELEEYELSTDGITLFRLKTMWKNREVMADFYKIIAAEIPCRKIMPETMRSHYNAFRLLKEYKPKCKVCDLDEDWVRGFYFFISNKINRYGRLYSAASINKLMESLECYYRIARRMFGNKVPNDSFAWHKYLKVEKHIKSLKENEIFVLENYALRKKSKVIDQFLFMSYTGMRIGDFANVTEANITREGNDKMWLTYSSNKTNIYTRLPLSSLFDRAAEKLMYKYEGRLSEFFCTGDRAGWNRKLNRHAKKAGLQRYITAHMARHTCATRLLEKDVPMPLIMKVLGHTKLETTMIYARITDDTLAKKLLVS